MPTTPYLTIDQSKTILSLLKDLEVKLAAIVQAAIPPTPQSDPSSLTQQSESLAKRKRNQRTRKQHKRKKAQAQAQRVTVQELDHMQEVDLVQISVEKASKHEAFVKSLTWNGIPTVAWHAVIPWIGMTSFDGAFVVQNGAIGMRRMGVG